MAHTLCVILAVIAIFASANAFYDGNPDIVELTDQNFEQTVMSGNTTWLVEFYATYCGHCKNLIPIYEKAAEKLKNYVGVAAINTEQHNLFAQRYQIQGVPTLKLFVPGKRPVDYNGQRSARAIVEFALKHQTSAVRPLTPGDDGAIALTEMHNPTVILFSKKKSHPPVLKALSVAFSGIHFHMMKPTESAMSSLGLDLDDAPCFVSIVGENWDVTKYEGDIDFDDLKAFIRDTTGIQESKPQKNVKNSKKKKEEVVEELPIFDFDNSTEFRERCMEHKGFCVVAFLERYNSPEEMAEDVTDEIVEEFERIKIEQDEYVTLMEAVRKRSGSHMGLFNYFTASGPRNADLCDSMRLSFGFPAVVAIHPRSDVYTVFAGNFREDGIASFLRSVAAKRTKYMRYIFTRRVISLI